MMSLISKCLDNVFLNLFLLLLTIIYLFFLSILHVTFKRSLVIKIIFKEKYEKKIYKVSLFNSRTIT